MHAALAGMGTRKKGPDDRLDFDARSAAANIGDYAIAHVNGERLNVRIMFEEASRTPYNVSFASRFRLLTIT